MPRPPASDDQYYIRAISERADDRTLVLKDAETFAVFDRHGDIHPLGLGEQGVYHEGTRFLSRLDLFINDRRPVFLSSTVRKRDVLLTADLTNPDISRDGTVLIPRGILHLFRTAFLWRGACFGRFRLTNYGEAPLDASLALRFDGDFADLFEVRGTARACRGSRHRDSADGGPVLVYQGLDGIRRRMRLILHPTPELMAPDELRWKINLPARSTATFYATVICEVGEAAWEPPGYDDALARKLDRRDRARERRPTIRTGHPEFDDWLDRSDADLRMMTTETPHGVYPYAGIPWFSTPFGRDGIITALESLWLDPGLARGVLAFLAATQSDEEDPARDAEPGKILHEARQGEMANLGEVPFGRYYGAADTTPLFVLLAGAYWERTGDREFAEQIWPHVERALAWMRDYGDQDGDGFLEYSRRSASGLVNQGWKDSHDSVFHADGQLARPPIALVEIQGYAVAALHAAATLAQALGRAEAAEALRQQAERLREAIEREFWCEELGTYALALDGEKRPCRVRASNAGHLLFCGVPSPERARRTAAALCGEATFSGWGIRTVAETEARYNPMSYHNGSVWPHDNAVIAWGFARYGLRDQALRLLAALHDASAHFEMHRLPELYCGFPRREGEGPTAYPVACAPQSWAAAAVLLLIQGALGLRIDAVRHEVRFHHPRLPPWLKALRIRELTVGEATLDLDLLRQGEQVGIGIARRVGPVDVVVIK